MEFNLIRHAKGVTPSPEGEGKLKVENGKWKMKNSVYKNNKTINKPIEFKGLKAQYIWWLGGGLVALLLIFSILYVIGINSFFLVGFIIILGTGLFIQVYRLSNKYGEHGMMKKIASRAVPHILKSYNRTVFLKNENNGKSA